MDLKSFFGIAAVAVAFSGYIPYLRDTVSGKTKPHAFSWLVWLIITVIALFGQITGGAGPGAWVTGVTAVICLIVVYYGFTKGRDNIVRSDWYSLIGATAAIGLWVFAKSPVSSIILATLIDALAWIPNFRKSFRKPYEETLEAYVMIGLKHGLSILAIQKYSLVTALYPGYLFIANFLFVTMLIVRRKQVKH